MDPTKPRLTTVKTRDAATGGPSVERKAPSTSFNATLNAKLDSTAKGKVGTSTEKAKNPVLAAIEQAADPEAAAREKQATEQLQLQLVRSVLYGPKAAKIQIDRADDPNNED